MFASGISTQRRFFNSPWVIWGVVATPLIFVTGGYFELSAPPSSEAFASLAKPAHSKGWEVPAHYHKGEFGGGEEEFKKIRLKDVMPEYPKDAFSTKGRAWNVLHGNIRLHIDEGFSRKEWTGIRIGMVRSYGAQGESWDRYHQNIRGDQHGAMGHFLISADGRLISVMNRWKQGIPVALKTQDNHWQAFDEIRICIAIAEHAELENLPTVDQLRTLDELVRYLRLKLGSVPIQEDIEVESSLPEEWRQKI